MVYLIGGAPRCGKTILAKRLAKQLSMSWISADTLESIAKQYIPKENHARFFPKDLIREKTKSSNDIMYTDYTADEILSAYVIQSKTSWDAISMLVECMICDKETIIIEGHQIHPKLISELTEKYGEQSIRAIILTKGDVNQIVETARKGQSDNDWFIKKSINPEIHYKIGEMLSKYSNYFSEEAKKYEIAEMGYKGNFEDQLNLAREKLNTKSSNG